MLDCKFLCLLYYCRALRCLQCFYSLLFSFVCVHACVRRHAHPGHSAPGHASHAGQRAGAVLLRLLHLRHRRRAAVGGAPEEPLFHGRGRQDVSHRSDARHSEQTLRKLFIPPTSPDFLTSLKVCTPFISSFHAAVINTSNSLMVFGL